ncbi:MAG: hypothetical protein HC880_01060 [Bacteroidia bacterium]|nr:hypothetical protein [Bacteroidia bacterium]
MKTSHVYSLIFVLFILSTSAKAQSKSELARIRREAEKTMQYHEYLTAIQLYERLLKADPDNLDISIKLGIAHLHSSSQEEHWTTSANVYQKNPDFHPDLEFHLAETHHQLGHFATAKDFYQQAQEEYTRRRQLVNDDPELKEKEKQKKTKRLAGET